MKALVLTGVKEFEIQDLATPEILPNEVLINTAYAGVCGTDHDLYAGRPGSAAAVPPIVLGHENSGVVAAIGSEVTNVKVGDRVAVDPNIYCGQCEFCLTQRPELCDHLSAVGVTRDGGLAEQFTAPATVVYKLPDNVSLRDAAAIEPVSCAVHGLDLLKLRPYQKALVIGDGFMGQIFAQLLQAWPASSMRSCSATRSSSASPKPTTPPVSRSRRTPTTSSSRRSACPPPRPRRSPRPRRARRC